MKKIVYVREIPIGTKHVVIQSMTNTKTSDVTKTVEQINKLVNVGCEIVRVAVKDQNDAIAISKIKDQVTCPIVADIHFDYQLALAAIENGADKIRINPGNITKDKVEIIVNKCKEYNIPIRIGVNSGSLSKDIIEKYGTSAKALVEEMKREIEFIESLDYYNLILSIKATNISTFIEANKEISKLYDYPLHIGLTESGTKESGSIRSSYALGTLLNEGIGDTIRVSLTGDPINEIKVAKEILKIFNLYNGPTLISCPTCGRLEYNMENLINQVEPIIEKIKKPLKIAIMGCVVNGIGEGKEADLGIAGGKNQAVIFRKGQIIRKVDDDNLLDAFCQELDILLNENSH